MDIIIFFDLTIFIILALCLLVLCFGVISNIETFVSQNMDTVLVVSIIIAIVLAIASIILVAHFNKKKKIYAGLISGLLSLLAASQLVAYLYFGLTAIAGMGFWRIAVFILFVVYGIANIGVYLYAHFWIIGGIGSGDCKEDVLCGYLAPILVFVVGWLINLFIF